MIENPQLLQIKASAGSGKTYTLTRRFLELLGTAQQDGSTGPACTLSADGRHCWPEILAATFTNRAATEMKERVVRRLKEMALRTGESPEAPWTPALADRWVGTILRQYGALNIRTIDSLLTLLVRLSALDLRLPPDFEPAFAGPDFFEPLLDDVLETARHDDPALRDMLRRACETLIHHTDHVGFATGEKLRTRLLELLDWHLCNGALPTTDADAVRARLVTLHERMRHEATAVMRTAADENLAVAANFLKFLVKVEASSPFAKVPESAYLHKTNLDECLNKASRGNASAQADSAFAAFMSALTAFRTNGRLLQRALAIMPLVGIAETLARRLPDYQLREGKVPAQLLPQMARRVLDGEYGVSEAFCRMGTRLAHILVDEFQDTSKDQWAAIQPLAVECLSRGGSLTWVGDVKQAIYGWRGGDSALFDAVLRDGELLAIAGDGISGTLPRNWRSRPEIVHFNNDVFALLGDEAHATAVLRAMLPEGTPPDVFSEAVDELARAFTGAAQETPPRGDDETQEEGFVRLTHVAAFDSEELDAEVKTTLRSLFMGDLALRRRWRDVAVLVRTNGEAGRVATWLMEWDIPVVTENSLRLADHPLISQTVALLGFLDYPRDDLAFWEFAAGPELLGDAAGLDAPAMDDWLAEGGRGPLFTRFRDAFPAVWRRWIAPFYSRAGLMSVYDTVREVYTRFRVFDRYPEDAGFLRRFLEVVHAAEGQGLVSLSTFLDFWKRTGGDEKVPMPEGMDAVRVMTMHKAKGLEFPVVVIPFHHQADRADDTPVRMEVEGLDLLVPRCPEMGKPYYEAFAASVREQLHVLYVAWTRPVEELHAFITERKTGKGRSALLEGLKVLLGLCGVPETWGTWERGTIPASALADSAAEPAPERRPDQPESTPHTTASPARADSAPADTTPVVQEPAVQTVPPPQPAASACASETAPQATGHDTPSLMVDAAASIPAPASTPDDDWRPMQWLPRLKIFRNQLEEFTFTERRRGMLVHACLEALHPTGAPREDAARAVRHGIRAFPLPVPDEDAVAAELTTMLEWYAAQPETAHWLRHGTPEQGILDAQGRLHRTDLFVDDGNVRVVVEYKTGAPSPDHIEQVHRYLSLLLDADPRPVHGVLVYLDRRTTQRIDPAESGDTSNTIAHPAEARRP